MAKPQRGGEAACGNEEGWAAVVRRRCRDGMGVDGQTAAFDGSDPEPDSHREVVMRVDEEKNCLPF